jgi:hypothetical protein
MEVRLFPNSSRPGVGVKPRRESQRPLLPQHSRHCPVLEAGSALGFLVYPPLEQHESFYIDYQGEGQYRFVYYVNVSGKWQPMFGVMVVQPVGGAGMFREEVTFMTETPMTTRDKALLMARAFMVPEDLGTPAGALSLRGAWNFQTPPGWDTVYTPIFNVIERPIAPMLVIRVETDWYAHETEFRYVLQPGEGISASHGMPIGQVVFVPREEITLRDCNEEEVAAIRRSQVEFAQQKAAVRITTSLGLPHSPHYIRLSRSQSQVRPDVAPVLRKPVDREVAPLQDPPTDRVGRNDPCPCGSGRKYKKCHGAAGT